MSGTEIAYGATSWPSSPAANVGYAPTHSYAMPGTHVSYVATNSPGCVRYAMSGIEIGYAPTQFPCELRYCDRLCGYAIAMRCPVLR
eukprot:1946760-Rhodomonas_salina.2